MTDFQPPRGTSDLLPPESERVEALAAEAAALAKRYGFRRIDTPAFEHTELFVRGVGASTDIVAKEMYTFEDQGGRSLTLRPEGTAPVVRAYLQHRQDLPTPFKAYYVVPMFRHERPQAGRTRQHLQFGVEIVGSDAPTADVEVIEVAHRFLSGRGIERYALHLNSIGDERCRPAFREALVSFLDSRADRLHPEHRRRYRENPLRVLDCKEAACREATEDAPRMLDHLDDQCRAHFERVREGLDTDEISYQIDHRLVRGLDYYTRTTFEFVSDVLGPTQSTLCGGGRYDGLAEVLGGAPTPGIGFGLGLERLLLAIGREGATVPEVRGPDVFLVGMGEPGRQEARRLLRALREDGVAADAALDDRPLKAQLRMADRSGALHAAILGEQELDEGIVTVRRMSDGHQERVKIGELSGWLLGAEP